MKPICYRPHVWPDILVAGKWYEREQPGLGGEFVEEVERLFELIGQSPQQFPIVWAKYNVRRCLLDRFPYAIYFTEEGGEIVVVSVIHCKRSSRVWKRHVR